MSAKKNTTSGRQSAAGGKTTAKGSASKTGTTRGASAQKNTTKKGAAQQKAVRQLTEKQKKERRMYTGIACFILALFGMLGYFNTSAPVLSWFRTLASGLTGVGYLVLPPLLILVGCILIMGKEKYISRSICALLVPAVVGILYQLLLVAPELPDQFLQSTVLMWQSGILMESGGAFSGQLALWLSGLLSRPATMVIMVLALVLLVLHLGNSTLAELLDRFVQWLDAREAAREQAWEDGWEDDEPEEAPPAPRPRPAAPRTGSRTAPQPSQRAAAPGGKRLTEKLPFDSDEEDETRSAPEQDVLIYEPLVKDTPKPAAATRTRPKKRPAPPPEEPEPFVNDFELLLDMDLSGGWEDEDWEDDGLDLILDVMNRDRRASARDALEHSLHTNQTGAESDPVFDPDMDQSGLKNRTKETTSQLMDSYNKGQKALETPEGFVSTRRNKRVGGAKKNAAQPPKKPEPEPESEPEPEGYQFPSVDLLTLPRATGNNGADQEQVAAQLILEETLESFGINPHITGYTRGPSVGRYEMQLDRGVKLSKLTNLSDDIALSLGVSGVRIAAVPDKPSTVGIEVPNRNVTAVPIRQVIDSEAFRKSKSSVSFALGMDIAGTCIISDIAKMPHLMIAGTTGSGKSVCINSLLISLLYRADPEDVKLIMVDPKQVELQVYNDIPHLLLPVVTEAKKATGALQWAVLEMTRRYTEIAEAGTRKIDEYNKLAEREQAQGGSPSDDPEHPNPPRQKLPYIVIVIDELTDLMMVAGKEVEESICRIAQLGRAAGMHLVVATQRPSSDVITGLMKANISSRIAFSVASAIESRIILDTPGAEKLVGKGDMLYRPNGANRTLRVQGCLISDEEVAAVVDFVKQQSAKVVYDDAITKAVEQNASTVGEKKGKPAREAEIPEMEFDEKLVEAMEIFLDINMASTSHLQRRLKLGHSRAGRVMDQLEELGLIGPFEGSKPRTILVTREEWEIKRQSLLQGGIPEQVTMQDMNNAAMEEDRKGLAGGADE